MEIRPNGHKTAIQIFFSIPRGSITTNKKKIVTSPLIGPRINKPSVHLRIILKSC